MKTISESVVSNTITIKKSEFITLINKIVSEDDAILDLELINKRFSDATHICYAYVVNNKEKCFDDNEPSETAGKPILNVIKQKKLTNVLVVVIRYFGGVKLGVGGLVRAYTEAVTECLKKATIIDIKQMCNISFHIDYDKAFNIYVLTNLKYFSILERVGNNFVITCEPSYLQESLNAIKQYNVTNIKIENVKV